MTKAETCRNVIHTRILLQTAVIATFASVSQRDVTRRDKSRKTYRQKLGTTEQNPAGVKDTVINSICNPLAISVQVTTGRAK